MQMNINFFVVKLSLKLKHIQIVGVEKVSDHGLRYVWKLDNRTKATAWLEIFFTHNRNKPEIGRQDIFIECLMTLSD